MYLCGGVDHERLCQLQDEVRIEQLKVLDTQYGALHRERNNNIQPFSTLQANIRKTTLLARYSEALIGLHFCWQ